MEFLVVINLILVIFAFLLIILLYMRQNRYSELERKYEQLNKELEETVASFILAMKEENERFLDRWQHLNEEKGGGSDNFKDIAEENVRLSDETNYCERPGERLQDGKPESERDSNSGNDSSSGKDPNDKNVVTDRNAFPLNEHERLLGQVKELMEKGFDPPEIAKQLNRGKTEIELLIKFTPTLLKKRGLIQNVQESGSFSGDGVE